MLFDFNTFKNIFYVLFSFTFFFIFIDLYISLFYMLLYAAEYLNITDNFVFYLLIIMNAVLIFDHIILNIMTDKMSIMNILIFFILVTELLTVAWIWIYNVDEIIFFLHTVWFLFWYHCLTLVFCAYSAVFRSDYDENQNEYVFQLYWFWFSNKIFNSRDHSEFRFEI